MSLATKTIASPIGKLKLVASDKGLVAILWPVERPGRVSLGEMKQDLNHPMLLKTEQQLNEYFAGERKRFTVPLDMRGTSFQQSVWKLLLEIPFGETSTYGAMAKQLGKEQASRAVGASVGRNPISVIVPCHRVLGSTGKLTGFAGGLETKAQLLQLEGIVEPQNLSLQY